MIKAVLFDCDGVLLNSEKIYLESVCCYLKNLGRETQWETLAYLVGADIQAITVQLKKDLQLEELSDEEVIKGQRQIFNERFYGSPLTPMEGLVPLLETLRDSGITLGVVSSSGQDYVEYVLKQLNIGEYFQLYIGREAAERSKPCPDLYLEALRRLGLTPAEAVIVEDSFNGIKAGKAAGCHVIAYTGSGIRQDITGADQVIDSYGDFPVEELIKK